MKTKERCNRQCQGTLWSGADICSVADEWYPGGLAALAKNTNKSFRFSKAMSALPHEIISEGTSEVPVRAEDSWLLLLWGTMGNLGHAYAGQQVLLLHAQRTATASCCRARLLTFVCPWAGLWSLVATPPHGCAYPLPSPPTQVLRRVGSGLDEEHRLLSRVDIYRMTSVISCLLLRMKDTSGDWAHR